MWLPPPGVSVVSGGNTRTWPHGDFGVCGNRADDPNPRWLTPRPIQATYTEGDVVRRRLPYCALALLTSLLSKLYCQKAIANL